MIEPYDMLVLRDLLDRYSFQELVEIIGLEETDLLDLMMEDPVISADLRSLHKDSTAHYGPPTA